MRLTKMFTLSCLVLLLTGCKAQNNPTAPTLLDPVGAQKEYGMVTLKDLNEKEFYNAYVTPSLTFVSSPVNGTISELYAQVGDHVKEGDVLAALDSEEIEKEINYYSRRLDALNQMFTLNAKLKQTEIQISQASYSAAGQNAQNLQTEIDRVKRKIKKLTKKNRKAVSENSIANSITKSKNELQQYKDQISAYEEEKNDYSHQSEAGKINQELDLELYEIDKKECEQALVSLKEKKAFTQIKAPCSGTVVSIAYINDENNALPANDPFIILAENDITYITIPGVKENQIKNTGSAFAVIAGKKYPLTQAPYDAEYKAMNRKKQVNYSQKDYGLDIRFTCQKEIMQKFSPGDFVSVYIINKEKKNALCAPNDTIYQTTKDNYVIKIEDGREIKTQVETGMRTTHETEIISGVEEGDTLLSKNTFFEADGMHETPLKPCDYKWEESVNRAVYAPLRVYAVKSDATQGRLTEICVDEYDVVKKGDILAKVSLYSNQSEQTRLSYQKETLAADEETAIKEIQKQQRSYIGQLDLLQKETPDDPMIAVLKLQISYFDLLVEQTKAQFRYDRLAVEDELANLKAENDKAIIRAQCDGTIYNINQKLVGKMLSPSDEILAVMPNGNMAISVWGAQNLVYGMPVTVSGKEKGNDVQFGGKVAFASNVTFPWLFANNTGDMETIILADDNRQLNDQITNGKVTASTRIYRNVYKITPKMMFTDDYGNFVYLMKDGKRIKQYVTLTEFHDGFSIVLDGISEDCILLEREKE